ncbi:anti-sigma factor family protein [Saccharibacillus endophyticus]|uniref:Uncharacterized protein n=1 Tax=Saccharibacillus endophyticus TaxID=2060666 RepID=A0ABQ1ZQ33_9BACL|nr:hypothetical protein [Saccharibacillus endophyticus]GGH74405.1 hypothetical protein GCM10007362_14470 [Saccharibacillus endophyticus]
MKREEALEYMNRYLDHDLTKEETDTLFRHLGESPEAREDFEFLQGLSDQLESLPDVKPPVSLVDSILPKLDEIDRLAAIAAPEAQPEKLSEMESKRMLGEQVPKRRRAAAFWRSTLGRTVGGTAVAAAVLGIFVVNYEPKEMPNAEMSSTAAVTGVTDETIVPSNGAQTESGAVQEKIDPSTEADTMQPETKLAPSDEPGQNAQTEPEEEPADSETAAPTESSTSNEANPPSVKSQPTEDGDNAPVEPKAGTSSEKENDGEVPNNPVVPNADQPKADTPSNKEGTSRKNPGASEGSQPSADSKNNQLPAVESVPPAAPPVQEDSQKSAESSTEDEAQPNEGIGTFSIKEQPSNDRESADVPNNESDMTDSSVYSLTVAPSEWTSPDGTYVITYSPNTLKLLKGDRSKELNSHKVDGDVTGGVWSADGKTFTYDLVKADGTTAQGIWKIEEVALQQGGK